MQNTSAQGTPGGQETQPPRKIIVPHSPAVKEAFAGAAKEGLALAWASFKFGGEDGAADEVETLGKKQYGGKEFDKAMDGALKDASSKAEDMVGMHMG